MGYEEACISFEMRREKGKRGSGLPCKYAVLLSRKLAFFKDYMELPGVGIYSQAACIFCWCKLFNCRLCRVGTHSIHFTMQRRSVNCSLHSCCDGRITEQ